LESSENSYGIYLQQSSGNTIQDNECLKNWVGVLIYNSNNNIVNNNLVEDCEKGVSLYNADSNTLLGNSISKGWYGIRLYSSNYNQIFHNNLIENTYQADSIESIQNNWNSSFEGNFWSDYTGNDIDRDGIGDFPYIIVNGSLIVLDYHPLLGKFHSFSIYYEEKTYEILVITNSTILNLDFESTHNIINLRVNGSEGNYGFCRISIPHAIVEPEVFVIIDDGTTEVLSPNYFVHDDGASRWIYFAYLHSTHEIKIVPEFNTIIILVTSILLALYALILKRVET
jgi:parallel beta-helix repeat protein